MTVAVSWEDLWQSAKAVDIVSAARELGAKLKKSGREWVGPCPAGCSTTDGFSVNPVKGVFRCRKGDAGGDVIEMAAHCLGLDRVAAAERLAQQERPNGRGETDEKAQAEAAAQRAKQAALNARRTAAQAALEAARLVRDGEAVASLLDRAEPFPGSRAEDYLIGRGANVTRAMARDLRFIEQVHYWGHGDLETDEVTLIATLPVMAAIIRSVSGEVVGLHLTYLDPKRPAKWVAPWEAALPASVRRNPAKKFRKTVERLNGSMIRLGAVSETLVLGEGIETVGSYFRRGFAPEDASFGVAMSLGNLAGGAVAQIYHPTLPKPATIANGIPDPEAPGVMLPAHVKRVILLGDGDSEPLATGAALLTAARRYRGQGVEVWVDRAPPGADFASMPREVEAATA